MSAPSPALVIPLEMRELIDLMRAAQAQTVPLMAKMDALREGQIAMKEDIAEKIAEFDKRLTVEIMRTDTLFGSDGTCKLNGARLSSLELWRATLLGWVAGVSGTVALVVTGIMWAINQLRTKG